MRIISGEYRGRKLASPDFDGVRPTSDMVRENTFNLILAHTYGAAVLDLFAGSGAMGIEALSRGASRAVFADIDKRCTALVRCNLDSLKLSAEVLCAPYNRALAKLNGRRFDIIFVDPPYGRIDLTQILQCIEENNALADDGIVVYEFSEYDGLPALGNFEAVKKKRYGKTGVAVLCKKQQVT